MKLLIRYAYILAILFSMSMQSCTVSNVQVMQSPEAAQTAIVTPTVIPPKVTATSTSVPFQEDLSCWPIKPLNKNNDIKGSILFGSRGLRIGTNFVWDTSSFHTRKINDSFSSFSVSTDGSLLVTKPEGENRVVLISSTQTKSYPLYQPLPEGKDYLFAHFLLNGLIAVRIFSEDENPRTYAVPDNGYTYDYYLLDPTTGNLTPNSILLPDFGLGTGVFPFPIEFSPDMQYVVYHTKHNNGEFALMDVKNKNIIWTGLTMPHWKVDGSSLTYFDNGNLFSLSKDGKSTQITWFGGGEPYGMGPLYNEVPWSPNGRYVVFRIRSQPSVGLLYIWDGQDKVAFRPCLPDELRAYSDYFVNWSFDSKSLLIRLVYPDEPPSGERPPPSHFLDLILDVSNQIIYTLPEENNRGQYGLEAPDGAIIADWVNWEIP